MSKMSFVLQCSPQVKKNAKNYFYYDVIMSVKLTLPTDISVVILAGGSIFLISPYLEHFPH